jgi:hypothetical protein
MAKIPFNILICFYFSHGEGSIFFSTAKMEGFKLGLATGGWQLAAGNWLTASATVMIPVQNISIYFNSFPSGLCIS